MGKQSVVLGDLASEAYMKILSFHYRVLGRAEFTRKEIDCLIELALSHYDCTCQSLGREGGVLYGLRNQCGVGESVVHCGEFRDFDLIGKICEQSWITPDSGIEIGRASCMESA